MAQKLKHQQNSEGGGNVVNIGAIKCTAEGCSKKVDRLNFCKDHYDWFKFGLITKEGKKPSDFDKKHMAWQKSKKVA